MKKVLKSYMITFFKSWIETIGTILFLLIQSTVVLGMLTNPIQIQSKVSALEADSNTPENYIYVKSSQFSQNFMFNYFINAGSDEEISDNVAYKNDYLKLHLPKGLSYGTDGSSPFLDLTKINSKVFLTANNFSIPITGTFYDELISDGDLNDFETITFIQLIYNSLDATFGKITDDAPDKIKTLENKLLDSNNTSYVLSKEYTEYIFNNLKNDYYYAPLDIYKQVLGTDGTDFNYSVNLEYGYAFTKTSFDIRTTDIKHGFSHVNLNSGRSPTDNNNSKDPIEVLASTAFMKANDYKLGQIIGEGARKFKIVGTGSSYETIMNGPNYNMLLGRTSKEYGYLYTTSKNVNEIFNAEITRSNLTNGINKVSMLIRVNNLSSKYGVDKLFVDDAGIEDKGILSGGSSPYYTSSTFTPISGLKNIKVQLYIYIVLGAIVLSLAFVFLNFVIKKELNQSRIQIGIFKAMGYKSSELSWIFALKTLVTIFIGIVLGYICSIPLQIYAAGQYNKMVTILFNKVYYAPLFLFLIFIVLPIFFGLISYLLTLRDLKQSSLELMKNAIGENKKNYFLIVMSIIIFPLGILKIINKFRSRVLSRTGRQFGWRMRYSFTNKGLGKFIMVIFLISFSSFMFMAIVSASIVVNKLVTDDFNEYAANIDNKVTWSHHTGFVVEKDQKTKQPKLVFDNSYNNDNGWKPSDLRLIETSSSDYNQTINNDFDTNISNNVSTLVSYSINKIINQNDGKFNSDSEFVNGINIRIAKAIFASLLAPITNEDKLKSYVDNIYNMSTTDFFAYIAGILSGSTTLSSDSLFFQKAYENGKNLAVYMKDIEKIGCMITILGQSDFSMTNGIIPDINNSENWIIFSKYASYNTQNNLSSSNYVVYSSYFGETLSNIFSCCSTLDTDNSYNPLLTVNSLVYDKATDFLFYSLKGTKSANQNIDDPQVRLVDATDTANKYGNIKNGFNMSDDALNQYYALANNYKSKEENSASNPINMIVSYRYAEGLNLNVGDITTINFGSKIKKQVYGKIIAIDKNTTFSTAIYMDNITFMNQILSDKEDDTKPATKSKLMKENIPMFNSIVSTKTALKGSINLNKIAESINSIKNEANSFYVAMENDKEVFPSLLNNILTLISNQLNNDTFTKFVDSNVDQEIQLLNKISLISGSKASSSKSVTKKELSSSSFTAFKITYALVKSISKIATQIMSIFVVLNVLLLIIVLVVIMSIVIDESARIILTMRAIGYKNRQINWMVMGNYIIWSIIGFALSYICILLLWFIVSKLVWSNYNILITIPWTMKIPGIAIGTISVILLVGWFTAITRINKHKLTQITD